MRDAGGSDRIRSSRAVAIWLDAGYWRINDRRRARPTARASVVEASRCSLSGARVRRRGRFERGRFATGERQTRRTRAGFERQRNAVATGCRVGLIGGRTLVTVVLAVLVVMVEDDGVWGSEASRAKVGARVDRCASRSGPWLPEGDLLTIRRCASPRQTVLASVTSDEGGRRGGERGEGIGRWASGEHRDTRTLKCPQRQRPGPEGQSQAPAEGRGYSYSRSRRRANTGTRTSD